MEKRRILVVDDEQRMRQLLRDFLMKNGYEVLEAGDGKAALDVFERESAVDLILLDVMMPQMDGYEVCKEIRTMSDVPVIMLTAKSEEQDELRGFEAGVDEYISKPFSPKILMARVEAILRRTSPATVEDAILERGGICLDRSARTCIVDGREVELSYKEFELLAFFLENPGVALSRDRILDRVWNVEYYGAARTIDTHVKKLRSKIGPKGDLIHTVWGVGYKFEE